MRGSESKYTLSGFTLIDLIVSIAIFGVMTGAVIVNFRAGSRSDNVRRGASITASTLRQAQTMTLSGTERIDGTFPSGGYGVRLSTDDTDLLTIFADSDANGVYTDATELIETVTLPQDVTFAVASTVDIVFSAPDADILFNGVTTASTEEITLSVIGADTTKTVTVFRLSGQIRIE